MARGWGERRGVEHSGRNGRWPTSCPVELNCLMRSPMPSPQVLLISWYFFSVSASSRSESWRKRGLISGHCAIVAPGASEVCSF